MKEYRITHREELIGYYYVEAETEAAALRKYAHLVSEGKIDFSDMELIDSSDTVDTV